MCLQAWGAACHVSIILDIRGLGDNSICSAECGQGCICCTCRGSAVPRLSPPEVEAAFARLPAGLRASLLPFQRAGVRYGLARQGRILLADEMGVGKTLQAIALAACYEVGLADTNEACEQTCHAEHWWCC